MVKISLLDNPEAPEMLKAFISLERHGSGFAVVITDEAGDKHSQPFILFLKTNVEGKLRLSLATSPNANFIERNEATNVILEIPTR